MRVKGPLRITWSLPVRGERLDSTRGDLVRARRLIEALRGLGHDVEVVEDAADPIAQARVSAYRTVVRRALPGALARGTRDLGRLLHARGHAQRVATAASLQGADVLVETQVHLAPSGALAAAWTGTPLVLDDCSPWTEEILLGGGLPGLARRSFRRQAAAAGALVVPTRRLAELLAPEIAGGASISVIPNGVDLDEFRKADRPAVRARLGFDEHVVIAFVGSFQPWHRVELLVHAVARLETDCPVALLLLGDGPGRLPTLELAARLGVGPVLAPGRVASADVPHLLAAADIGALPHSNDYGQPMKLLDYAAAGLAIVAPDLPPVREVVTDVAEALLFTPGDVDLLAAAIDDLVTWPELRERLTAAARRRVLAGASWSERAQVLEEALRHAIAVSPQPMFLP